MSNLTSSICLIHSLPTSTSIPSPPFIPITIRPQTQTSNPIMPTVLIKINKSTKIISYKNNVALTKHNKNHIIKKIITTLKIIT